MADSDESIFAFCDMLQEQGIAKSSFDTEKELQKKFWWMTRLQAAMQTKRWAEQRTALSVITQGVQKIEVDAASKEAILK